MKVLNPKTWGTALGAGLIATVALLPQAQAELVYENSNAAPAAPAATATANAQVDDRSTMRQALGASEKAQVTLQAQATAAPQTAPVEAAAPVAASGPSVTETENMSKADLMRRERQREDERECGEQRQAPLRGSQVQNVFFHSRKAARMSVGRVDVAPCARADATTSGSRTRRNGLMARSVAIVEGSVHAPSARNALQRVSYSTRAVL